ncbi:MAG TPA: response regulator [Pirellulales bacterium]|jgi:two-component system cell cycle sensor histidine kinase/response regulator CckA
MAKVLVVDDEAGYRASLKFFLTQAGNEVVAVATALDAANQSTDFRPDVLVADWLIGDRSTGADLARVLRKRFPDLRIIFITGLGASMVRQQIEDLNVFQLLEKPFEPRQLVDAVRQAVEGITDHGPVGS